MSRAFMKENDKWARCRDKNRDCMFAHPDGTCSIDVCRYGAESPVGQPAAPIKRPAPPVRRPADVDTSAVRPGSAVLHGVYGAGTVKRLDGSHVLVSFGKERKEFQFPAAFLDGYLTLTE